MESSELRAQLADLHPHSFGWAMACCRGDRTRAEDVLQIAYLKVLEGRARFGGQSALKTWFFGVIRNAAREEWRRHQLRKIGLLRYEAAPGTATAAASEPDRELARKETGSRIRAALGKLSPRQQEVLHLVFYQDLTIEAAAAVMRISLGSARTHYQRGKQQLRKILQQEQEKRSANEE